MQYSSGLLSRQQKVYSTLIALETSQPLQINLARWAMKKETVSNVCTRYFLQLRMINFKNDILKKLCWCFTFFSTLLQMTQCMCPRCLSTCHLPVWSRSAFTGNCTVSWRSIFVPVLNQLPVIYFFKLSYETQKNNLRSFSNCGAKCMMSLCLY